MLGSLGLRLRQHCPFSTLEFFVFEMESFKRKETANIAES